MTLTHTSACLTPLGLFEPAAAPLTDLPHALYQLGRPLFLTRNPAGGLELHQQGSARLPASAAAEGLPLLGYAAPLPLAQCGQPRFLARFGLRYPLLGGSMAKGISSTALVIALGQAGMLGFFGAAGLSLPQAEQAIDQIQQALPTQPYGFNLIHSPNEPELEQALVDLYQQRGVRLIEASAFLALTPALVAYRLRGLRRAADGRVEATHRIIAKVSREEVALPFLSPAPARLVQQLLEQGRISAEQAELAAMLPMADALTAEADSGGHTDNRPALALLPTLLALRDRLQQQYRYAEPVSIGLGGGIATPQSVAAAFSLGADYLVTGSVNQACREAGTSALVRQMLAEARQADIAMAPAADMFEMGVTVQVLKRGTLFAQRGAKLYDLYRRHASLEEIPAAERAKLEKTVFQAPLEQVWQQTRAFFAERDPRQVERAERDPRHRMALVFRSYLGQATHWAIAGSAERKVDFQIWCGPAMAAFNSWTEGSPLALPENRTLVDVNLNLLLGGAAWLRARQLGPALGLWLRQQGQALQLAPLSSAQLKEYLA